MTARPAVEGTEADVRLVADILDDDIDCAVWCTGCDSTSAARRVIAALAEAGRLLPEEARRHLDGLRHASRHLNQPMLNKLRTCAQDDSPNWDGRITIYPPEASGLVALIDAADAVAAEEAGEEP